MKERLKTEKAQAHFESVLQKNKLEEFNGFKNKDVGLTDIPAHLVSEKWAHACARIYRILEPRGNVRAEARKGIQQAIKECSYPDLARRYVDIWFWSKASHLPSKWNPFYGLTDGQKWRKFQALVYQICDESTKYPGLRNWYTK